MTEYFGEDVIFTLRRDNELIGHITINTVDKEGFYIPFFAVIQEDVERVETIVEGLVRGEALSQGNSNIIMLELDIDDYSLEYVLDSDVIDERLEDYDGINSLSEYIDDEKDITSCVSKTNLITKMHTLHSKDKHLPWGIYYSYE